jgi:hypothetical protein
MREETHRVGYRFADLVLDDVLHQVLPG